MTVDLDTYSANKQFAINWLSSRNVKDLTGNITQLAVFTHCPCIVIAYYAGEAFGWSEELLKYIKGLKDFYGYTAILNKPPGCPIE